jgi:hypothetical protein
MEKWRYSIRHFQLQDKLEVSGRLHVSIALFPRKNSSIHCVEGSAGHSYGEENSTPLTTYCKSNHKLLGVIFHSVVTILTELSRSVILFVCGMYINIDNTGVSV